MANRDEVPTVDVVEAFPSSASVLTKMGDLQESQSRVERALAAIQRDLGRLVACQGDSGGDDRVDVSWKDSRKEGGLLVGAEEKSDDGRRQLLSPLKWTEAPEDSAEGSQELGEAGLPVDWPASVRIRHIFEAPTPTQESRHIGSTGTLSKRTGTLSKRMRRQSDEDTNRGSMYTPSTANNTPFWHRFVMDPNSVSYAAYSLCNVIVLLYDLTIIPLALAWDIHLQGGLYTLALCSCIFWTLDMFVGFFTGFQKGKHVEMQPVEVAKHFLRTMFLPDLVMATSNWVSLILEEMAHETNTASRIRIIRFAQIGKLLRVTSLLRLGKVTRVIDDIIDRRFSDTSAVLFKCTMVVAGTLWINHLIGCAWFALGRLGPSDTGFRWTMLELNLNGSSLAIEDSGGVYQYITAMHWGLAQLTMGANEVNPTNTGERIFGVCCLAVGLIFGSTLISSLSATMVDFQMAQKSRKQEIRRLRSFLQQNSVSEALAMRVEKQARERLSTHEQIQEKDVHVLNNISKSLLSELRCEIVMPHLNSHPLIRMIATCHAGVMRHICQEATQSLTLLQKDDLFCAGTPSDRAYFLIAGQMEYTQEPSTAPVVVASTSIVPLKSWLAEASLWSMWTHVGTAKAVHMCQVLEVSAEGLQAALSGVTALQDVTAEYCRQFHRRITAARPPDMNWPNDLHVPHTEYDDLVMSMESSVRIEVGLWALEYALRSPAQTVMTKRFSNWTATAKADKLRDEVQRDTCCVVLNAEDQLERMVPVIVLTVETKSDKKVFVELGQVQHDGNVKPSCRLPARKQEIAETRAHALDRLLKCLGLESHRSEVHQVERCEETRISPETGVRTKYFRTLHSLILREEDLTLPVVPGKTITKNSKSIISNLPSEAWRRSPTQALAVSSVESATVYKVWVAQKTTLYAWLPQATFKHLSSPAGERDLKYWLSSLSGLQEEEESLVMEI